MKNFYILQDSAMHQRDLTHDVAEYMSGGYSFTHVLANRFKLVVDGDDMVILHRRLNKENYKPFNDFYRKIFINKLETYLDMYDNVFVMVADMTANINDQEILKGISFYHRLPNSEFIDCETGNIVNEKSDKVACLNFLTFFKFNKLPISVGILNNEVIVLDDAIDTANIHYSNANKTIKKSFFCPEFTSGVETIIGKEQVFVNKDIVTLKLFPAWIEAAIHGIDVRDLFTISTNISYRFDGKEMTLDFSDLPPMSNSFLRLEFCVHEFFEKFVYQSQRSFYEYAFYKMR